MDELIEEYGEWFDTNDLASRTDDRYGADELLLIDAAVYRGNLLNSAEREWLRDFIIRWDRQQELLDRISTLRVAVSA